MLPALAGVLALHLALVAALNGRWIAQRATVPAQRVTLRLDSDATRRAIRASARTSSLGDRLAQSREEPRRPSANDRLAVGVHDAGKGDCMKGEYAGAGMGLLSLPFLAAAGLSGDCAK